MLRATLVPAEDLKMKYAAIVCAAAALAGCATQLPGPQALARHHADNLAAADRDGYRVVNRSGQSFFCPTGPSTGSHVTGVCLTEAQWEERELWVWSGAGWVAGPGESGRSPNEGSLAPYVGR
jgi:hypothetical protein